MGLKTTEKIWEKVKRRPAEIEKLKSEGKKVVGWINYNVPEEVIHAAGAIPIHLGTGGNDRLVELGSRYISIMNCVFTRQLMGLFAEGKDEYIKNSDAIVIDVTCKQLFRVAELVKFYFGANVELLGVPYNHESEAAFSYFRSEVKAFAKKMERVSGNEISEEALGKSVALFESIRSSIRELYERQSRPETPISWREVYETVQAGYYLDKEEYLTLLRELLDEIGESPNDARISASAPRLLLSGSVIPPGDRKILCIIEDAGARIVVDDLWSGFAPHFDTFVKSPDIDGIADAYLGRHPHASLPSLDIATDRRLPNIRSLINEYRADGVLFHTLRYCDCFTFKANETKQALRDYGIPFLEIHTEYAGSDFEAIRTRVEAFVESFSSRIQAASA